MLTYAYIRELSCGCTVGWGVGGGFSTAAAPLLRWVIIDAGRWQGISLDAAVGL